MKRKLSKIISILVVLTLLLPLGAYAAESESNPPIEFEDVSPDDWFYPYVQFVCTNNIMQGIDRETFAPNAILTRTQVAATLFRMHYGRTADTSDSRSSNFTDVSENNWFSPYVAWGSSNSIVSGVGNNRFVPHDNVTRQQLAVMLYRFADTFTNIDTSVQRGEGWNNFRDRNQIASWAVDGLTWANYHRIITGKSETTIAPTDTVSRAEAAAMLTRFVQRMRSTETGVSADDFELTISVEETTLPFGENFRVYVELKNNSGEDHEIYYSILFMPFIPGWADNDGAMVDPPEYRPRHFNSNATIQWVHAIHTFGYNYPLKPGVHELRFRASFILNLGDDNDQRISIRSNVVLLTVE